MTSDRPQWTWHRRWHILPWRRRAVLLAPYTWHEWTVPAGFRWDGPTFWPALPAVMRASLVHDYLYVTRRSTRSEADNAFRAILREDGAWFTHGASRLPWVRWAFHLAWTSRVLSRV